MNRVKSYDSNSELYDLKGFSIHLIDSTQFLYELSRIVRFELYDSNHELYDSNNNDRLLFKVLAFRTP